MTAATAMKTKPAQSEVPKTQFTLQTAERRIKQFIAKCYYGEKDWRYQNALCSRNLIFAANYAYECGGSRISSLIFELEGSPSKGSLCALIGGGQSDGGNNMSVLVGIVRYVEGKPVDRPTKGDYREVSRAIEAFIKEANVPIKDIRPVTAKNANEAISAYTKLKRK